MASTSQEDAVQQFSVQLNCLGWTYEAIDQKVKEIKARHSHHAGVSMAYLLQDFVELAQQESQEVDPTFLRLKEVFWCKDKKIGQDLCCPRDGKLGCALVDMLPPKHRQKQNHFMSWSWQYSLGQLRLSSKVPKVLCSLTPQGYNISFVCFCSE